MAADGKIIGTDVIDQSAHDAVIRFTKETDDLLKKYVELAGGITSFRAALGNVKGYKDVTDAINGQKEKMTELEKIKRQLVTANEKLIASQTVEAQLLERLKQDQRELNKGTADFVKEGKLKQGSLDEMRMKLNNLIKEYSALSAAERNASKGSELITHLNDVRRQVYTLETSMGNWTRNVGNYKSGFSAIGNSVAQIGREMPAFANSINTGFMAISNNIPALSDAIKGIREQNKLLAAEGKPTESVLKQLGGAVFSWNTLISIGVTLLTVYGGKIIEYLTGTEKVSEAQKKLNADLKETTKQYADTIANAEVNLAIIKNLNNSYSDRSKAYDALNSAYPELLTNMTKEEALNGGIADSYDGIIIAIERTMKKKAQYNLLETAIAEKTRVELEIQRLTNPKDGEFTYFRDDVMIKLNRELQIANDRIKAINDSIAKQNEIEAGALGSGLYKRITTAKKSTNSSSSNKTPNAPKEKASKDLQDGIASNINALDREVQLMNEKADAEAVKRVQDRLDKIKTLNEKYAKMKLDLIKENIAADEKYYADLERQDKERFDSRMKMVNDVLSIEKDFVQAFSTISEAIYASEMGRIDAMEGKMNQYYDSEEKRINSSFTSQADKDRELTKIAAQREAEQKKIDQDRRNAERKWMQAQKAYDIANIISSTAVAVMAALGQKPWTPLAIAAAAGIAATGAANLAKVIATPLPQYAEGTDNHPGGFAQVSERGTELGILPDGRKFLTPEKTTIMNLPARTKIIPHEELMKKVNEVAMIKLATSGKAVTENSMSIEMQESFNELSQDVKKLTKIMSGKDWSPNISVDTTHLAHVKSKVK